MTHTNPAAISAKILALINSGASVNVALDTVLGAGTFDRLASDIWNAAQEAK